MAAKFHARAPPNQVIQKKPASTLKGGSLGCVESWAIIHQRSLLRHRADEQQAMRVQMRAVFVLGNGQGAFDVREDKCCPGITTLESEPNLATNAAAPCVAAHPPACRDLFGVTFTLNQCLDFTVRLAQLVKRSSPFHCTSKVLEVFFEKPVQSRLVKWKTIGVQGRKQYPLANMASATPMTVKTSMVREWVTRAFERAERPGL